MTPKKSAAASKKQSKTASKEQKGNAPKDHDENVRPRKHTTNNSDVESQPDTKRKRTQGWVPQPNAAKLKTAERKTPSSRSIAPGQEDSRYATYLDPNTAPISDVNEMFRDMFNKGITLRLDFLKNRSSEPIVLTVGTVCSGTDAPLYALQKLIDCARNKGVDLFRLNHVFSCEIEGFKQAFIYRNHDGPLIFRNVVSLARWGTTRA